MHVASIGIDIGKTTFHRVALDEQGSVVVRKEVFTPATVGLYRQPIGIADRHRGLRWCALPGPSDC